MSKIEWTQETWNPIVGCSVVSPGCTNCYAMKMADRLQFMSATQFQHYQGTTQRVKGKPVWTGKMALAPDHILTAPLRRRKPTCYFVNSMSDLFHDAVPDDWILRVLDVIRQASYDGGSNIGRIDHGEGEHTFQLLTKRAARMRNIMRRLRWDGEQLYLLPEDDGKARVLLRNLWLGVSCEDQRRADERIPDLLATPAAVRFVSAEPLLGPIDFTKIAFDFGTERTSRHNVLAGVTNISTRTRLDWIIVGGESGSGARPMHPEWARSIRDQCTSAGVAFFFKQWGAHAPASVVLLGDHLPQDADAMLPVSKAVAGRVLDGEVWDQQPIARAHGR